MVKRILKLFLLLFIAGCIASVLFVVISIFSYQTSNTTPTQSNPELIECYVNGRRIQATRDDCQALSTQKEPVIIQEREPIRINTVPPIQIPRIKTTNCQWFGNILNCTEY